MISLCFGDSYVKTHSPEYPIGRSGLEAVSILTMASIMTMASIEIIQYSAIELYDGMVSKSEPSVQIYGGILVFSLLAVGIALKLALYLYCMWIYERCKSDTLDALAQDHLNDVVSNSAALIAVAVATTVHAKGHMTLWWVDPVGAIVISLGIIARWFMIIVDQSRKIVGYQAPDEFVQKVRSGVVLGGFLWFYDDGVVVSD